MPRPPALLTAATSSAVVYLDIPAWKIGTSIPNSWQTGVWRRAITRVSLYPVWPVVGLNSKYRPPPALDAFMNRILGRVRQRLGLRTTVRRKGLCRPKARIRIDFAAFRSPARLDAPPA